MLQNREFYESVKLRGVNLAIDETKLQVGDFTVLTNWVPDGISGIKKKRGVIALTDHGKPFVQDPNPSPPSTPVVSGCD